MNFVKKNKIIFFAFLFLFFIINKEIYAKSYKIDDMQIDAVVDENGDLQINQKIEYNFNGIYNGIYIDIPYYLDSTKYDKKRKQTSELKDSLYNGDDVLIKNVSVNNKQYIPKNNAENGDVGVYTQEKQNENLRVKVYSPSSYETKIFNVSYIIKNVAVSHTDVAEIYYNFIGGGWDTSIQNLNINILLPKNEGKVYAFAHGPYNGKVDIISNNRINLNVQDIKKGKFVAGRVVFSKNNVPNCKKTTDINALDIIMSDEKDIYDNIANKNKFTIKVGIFACVLLVYWLILVLFFEKEKKGDYEINEEELFSKYNPLIAGCIQGSRGVLSRDIIAVILNLVDKKILSLELQPNANGKDNYKYILKRKPKDNLLGLDNVEKYVYSWIFEESFGEYEINLADRLDQIGKEEVARTKFATLNKVAKQELNEIGANKNKVPKLLRIFNVGLLIFSIFVILIHFMFNGLSIYDFKISMNVLYSIFLIILSFFPLVITIFVHIIKQIISTRRWISKKIQKINGQKIVTTSISIILLFLIIITISFVFLDNTFIIADEFLLCVCILIVLTDNLMQKNDEIIVKDYNGLNGLKYKIEEYSLMEDRDIEQIKLWDKYIVYAISFGVASKILNRIDFMHLDDDLERLLGCEYLLNNIYNDYYVFDKDIGLDSKIINAYKAHEQRVRDRNNRLFYNSISGGPSIDYFDDKDSSSNHRNSSFSGGNGGDFTGGGGFSGGGGSGRRRWSLLKCIM